MALHTRQLGVGDPLNGGAISLDVDADLVLDLVKCARNNDVSLSAILFGSAAYALRKWTAQDDYTVGTVMSLRDKESARHVVGMLVQMVLVRITTHLDGEVAENVRSIHESLRGALAHRFTPLPILIDSLQLPRDAAENKVFDVMINFHPFADVGFDGLAAPFSAIHFIDNSTANAGLSLDFYEWEPGAIRLKVTYCKNLYSEVVIHELAKDVRQWLRVFSEGLSSDPVIDVGNFRSGMVRERIL